MSNKKKKFYISTSIAYTNAPPHIGFALELIQADVLARYHRLLGEGVFFLTGTDEHGQKIARAAEEARKTPKEFVDEISAQFRKLTEVLNISNDDFIRTSDQQRHWPSVYKIWLKFKQKGLLYKKQYEGLYCVGCEAFITSKDLVDGKCQYHQTEPEVIREENYFFRLSRYTKKIKELIEKDIIKIIPETRKNELLSFLKEGLEDISFSRPRGDLRWGIPTPDDPSQTIFVWCEALINYISAIGYNDNPVFFKKYWPTDVHCLGKDIFVRFHGSLWPAMLLALDLALPKKIFVHGFITVAGQKMSKSLGNIIDPFELVNKYGTDAVRYYLLAEIPPTEDGDFTYEKFEKRYNSDLASGIGNLVARVTKMVSDPNFKLSRRISYIIRGIISRIKIKRTIKSTREKYKEALNEFKLHEALKTVWDLIGFCDKHIEKEKPWNTKNRKVVDNLLIVLYNIAELLAPFLPETTDKILSEIDSSLNNKTEDRKSAVLFPRLDKINLL